MRGTVKWFNDQKGFAFIEPEDGSKDKFSGQSKGFGFVEMPSEPEAQSAIVDLNGTELKGGTLAVDKARPRPESQ